MILDNFYWLVSGYFSALTRLYYIAALFLRHLFTSDMSVQNVSEQNQVQEETGSIKQSSCACAEASHEVNKPRTNVFEGLSAADYADQVFISTNGDLVSVKQSTAGVGARQWGGQICEASVQHLSQSRGVGSADRATIDKAMEPETEQAGNFGQYGAGYKLDRSGI
jgi:hypothetical protein